MQIPANTNIHELTIGQFRDIFKQRPGIRSIQIRIHSEIDRLDVTVDPTGDSSTNPELKNIFNWSEGKNSAESLM